jgi:hypothetical protein
VGICPALQGNIYFNIKTKECLILFFCVTVPPEKLVIMDEEGAERTSVVGPYSEGADLALRCDVYGGKYTRHALRSILLGLQNSS